MNISAYRTWLAGWHFSATVSNYWLYLKGTVEFVQTENLCCKNGSKLWVLNLTILIFPLTWNSHLRSLPEFETTLTCHLAHLHRKRERIFVLLERSKEKIRFPQINTYCKHSFANVFHWFAWTTLMRFHCAWGNKWYLWHVHTIEMRKEWFHRE